MDSRENLWSRRSTAGKLSLSTPNTEHDAKQDSPFRAFSAKRFGPEPSQGRSNPFSAMSPGGMVSPTGGGSSAFGLGSGAFASFGSANKNSKPPGAPFDWGKASVSAATPTTPGERRDRPPGVAAAVARKESLTANAADEMRASSATDLSVPWPLKYTWVIWYRPPTPKNSDYEKSTKPLYRAGTAQDFWNVLVHLKHPSALPAVSDYHFFKDGIRPVWEDDENKRGGKWIMRLKKGVADRYWEELLMAMIGDQFAEAGDEVCGCVLSVRSGEDVFSVWTKNDGGRNIKIRETVKRVLRLPEGTILTWRSHDESIAQRSALDQAREKAVQQTADKRRTLPTADELLSRDKATAP